MACVDTSFLMKPDKPRFWKLHKHDWWIKDYRAWLVYLNWYYVKLILKMFRQWRYYSVCHGAIFRRYFTAFWWNWTLDITLSMSTHEREPTLQNWQWNKALIVVTTSKIRKKIIWFVSLQVLCHDERIRKKTRIVQWRVDTVVI